jgi:excinuclease ABC subunit A
VQVEWGDAEDPAQSHGSWGVRFEGIVPMLTRRFHETSSEAMREHYRRYLSEHSCEACGGHRLRKESLAVRVSAQAFTTAATSAVAPGRTTASGAPS